MIDDSGSGQDGTILNNFWKQELYDQIDALAGGDQVVDALTCDTLTVNQTSQLIGAVTANSSLVCGGGGANQLQVNGGIYSNESLTAPVLYEASRSTPMGYGIDIPYSASNFLANVGTWTVEASDQSVFRYFRIGKLVFVSFTLNNTSVSGSPSQLQIYVAGATPGGGSVARGVIVYQDAGGPQSLGWILANSTNPYLFLQKQSGTWATATNNTTINGSILYEGP
jgi:hypothetical protein